MLLSAQYLLFLAVLLPLYFVLPHRWQPAVLLTGSVVFYAFAGWRAMGVLLALTVVTYIMGRLLDAVSTKREAVLTKHRADGSWDKDTRRRYRLQSTRRVHALQFVGVIFLLLFPVAFKSMPGISTRQLLPGISFVTLSAISYLCDVARGQIACERNFMRLMLFIFYFPQMWQGPINRYGELAPQLSARHVFDATRATEGTLRMLWGGVKKTVIADTVAVATGTILGQRAELGGTGMVMLLLLYSLQLYADFTGGMDISLGVSDILGIELYENFDRPFASPSLKEYWRRWHRSLGRFFADYVFYPLSVSRAAQWIVRRTKGNRIGRRIPLYAAMLVTWLLTGLWHGIGANFVLWGLLNAVFMLFSQELRPFRARLARRFPRMAASRVWQAMQCCGTFLTVGLFRTLDLNPNPMVTLSLWKDMLTPATWHGLQDGAWWSTLGLNGAEWLMLGLGIVLMWAVGRASPRLGEDKPTLRARVAARPLLCGAVCALAITAIAVFGQYGDGYHAADFIYSRF